MNSPNSLISYPESLLSYKSEVLFLDQACAYFFYFQIDFYFSFKGFQASYMQVFLLELLKIFIKLKKAYVHIS